MVDISMCSGKGCSRKKDCFRFTATANKYRQSYFAEPPAKENGVNCDYFMSNKNLGEIFDEAMKKEGFKRIPVGPLPLRKLKKSKK